MGATPQKCQRSNFARQLPRHSQARGKSDHARLDVENGLRLLLLKQRQFEQVATRNDGATGAQGAQHVGRARQHLRKQHARAGVALA